MVSYLLLMLNIRGSGLHRLESTPNAEHKSKRLASTLVSTIIVEYRGSGLLYIISLSLLELANHWLGSHNVSTLHAELEEPLA
jgi:DNA-binding IclR family transcriptional regulator